MVPDNKPCSEIAAAMVPDNKPYSEIALFEVLIDAFREVFYQVSDFLPRVTSRAFLGH